MTTIATTMTSRSASHNTSITIDDDLHVKSKKPSNSSPVVLEKNSTSSRNRVAGRMIRQVRYTTTPTTTERRRTSKRQRLCNIFLYSIFAVQCFILQWNHSQEASSSLSQIQQQQQQQSFSSFFLLDRSSMSSFTHPDSNKIRLTHSQQHCIDTTTPKTTQEGTVFLHLGYVHMNCPSSLLIYPRSLDDFLYFSHSFIMFTVFHSSSCIILDPARQEAPPFKIT